MSVEATSRHELQAETPPAQPKQSLGRQMLSLFQTAQGSWHVPSILMASSWMIGSLVTGFFMVANLRVNRDDRIKSHRKESAANSKAIALESSLSETQTKLTVAEKDAREAHELARKVNLAAQPRRLTHEQKQSLTASLNAIPTKSKISLCAGILDAESVNFGEDIEAVLKAAGFEVYFPKELQPDASLMVGPPGLHLVVKDPKGPNPIAAKIQKCFMATGIELPGLTSSDSQFPEDRIEIAIGQR